jgi:hypothetical protein
MAFSARQLQALRRNLDHRHVRTREAHERTTSPLVTADDRLIRRCADTPFEKLVQSL